MSFLDQLSPEAIDQTVADLNAVSATDIDSILKKPSLSLADFPTLLSNNMTNQQLEIMAGKAHQLTKQRFGSTMQLFIPMYLSNECYNKCTYCGFSIEHKYPRVTLNDDEILKEGLILKEKGFQHLLLLTGEAPGKVGADYIANATRILRPHFSSIGIEVQPLSKDDYSLIIGEGADSLTLYQETYHPESYAKYHLSGKKKNFNNRLAAIEEGAKAGFYRINVGALLGLYNWQYEAIAISQHLDYLQKHYWQSKYAISFPRINDMFGDFTVEHSISDRSIVQFICAFRLLYPDLGISLSTREPAELRDHLIPLGITQLSAESHTEPGGYSGKEAEKQFEISDTRSLSEIKTVLATKGYETVMKDWDDLRVAT